MAHLKKRPSLLSVYDALCLSSDLRKALITALSFPEEKNAEVAKIDTSAAQCCSIEFSDEDLLLGTKLHNRPLLMAGSLEDIPVPRIMLDFGDKHHPFEDAAEVGIYYQ